jgi:hypothetical protein
MLRTAVGWDVLSLATFGGTFQADIEVKVQGTTPLTPLNSS